MITKQRHTTEFRSKQGEAETHRNHETTRYVDDKADFFTCDLEPRIHACVIRPKKQEGLKDTFKSVEHDMKPNSI